MFLKKLELFGFKSFAKKTTFKFSPGITAIVGPNGSGKSNIAEAILWVFGEKSAKVLRGEKMEDVIFTGTNEKNPLNMAEVSLTFDNSSGFIDSEYNEINVTRQIYRSGESNYFMNKKPCRRKDILETFMDTGIGKNAYSIISQGQIEMILSAKPVDRRYLFEEIAGISKYKYRKDEALKKLENCKEDLVRVSDLVEELKNQMEPLKKQAKTAKKYKKIGDKLKNTELLLFAMEIDDKRNKWYEHHNGAKELERELENLSGNNRKMEAKLEEQRNELLGIEKELEEKNEENTKIIEGLEKRQAQKRVYEEKKANLHTKIDHLQREIDVLDNQVQEEENKLDRNKKELGRLDEEYARLKTYYEKKENELKEKESNQGREDFEEIRQGLDRVITAKSSLNTNKENLLEKLEEVKKELKIILEDKNNKEKELKSLENRIKALEDEKGELENTTSKLDDKMIKCQNKLQEIKKTEEKLNRERQDLNNKLQEKKSRLKTLKEFEEDYRGYSRGVKEILKKKEKDQLFSGICGTVSDLIVIPEKYKTAIMTTLGGALSNLVVNTDRDAREVLDYLKKHKLGRATCLPLDNLTPRGLSANFINTVKESEGFCGKASELLKTESKYKVVADYLLGRVLVMEDMDKALILAKEINFKTRIVTLAGELILPGGAMIGGSTGKFKEGLGSSGKEKEALNLKDEIKSIEAQIENLDEKLKDSMANKDKQSREVERIKEDKYSYLASEKEKKNELENIRKEENRLQKEVKSLMEKKEKSLQREKDFQDKIKAIDEDIRTNQEEEEKLKKRQKEFETLNLNYKEHREKLEKELNDINLKMVQIKQNREYIKEKVDETGKNLDKINKKLQDYRDDLKYNQRLLSDCSSNEQKEVEELQELKENQKEVMGSIKEVREKKEKINYDVDCLDKDIKSNQKKERRLEKELNNANLNKKELETELKGLLNDLYEKYRLSFDKVIADYGSQLENKDNIDFDDLKNQIANYKDQMEKLRPVNLGAIEEYNNLKNRLEFLQKQKDDLLEAEGSLTSIIEDIDNVMKKRFVKGVNEINSAFKETFKSLFEGGDASLKLTTPGDPLNTGVEIEARPPGKKLQSLSLLSGGEKALTVISLLFSILKVKPTPFCILDEIDASLDDNNLSTYSKFLKNFTHETQFIVITHRKETMQFTDVLYGLSMAEAGVSKLISVDLNNMNDKDQALSQGKE